MSVPYFFPGPTATIIGTDLPSQTALTGFLNQLGFDQVQTADSWQPFQAADHQPVNTLYFLGWEHWGPEILPWIAKVKMSGQEAGTAKFFLIIPNEFSLNRVAAIQGGVDGFISYPYSLSNIRQKIQALLPTLAIQNPVSSRVRKQKKTPSQGNLAGGRRNP